MKHKFTVRPENELTFWALRKVFKNNENDMGNFLLEHFGHTARERMEGYTQALSEAEGKEQIIENTENI